MFIDIVNLFVKAGNGGNGAATFLRGVQKARGGPDGGNGGNGGNVYFQGSASLNDLRDYRYRKIIAEDGISGKNQKRHGKNAPHLNILLPFGTQVTDLVTQEATEITDIAPVLICRGGIGGRGNTEFKSAINQTPLFAEKGTLGEEKNLLLELRLIADIGLIGLPNAGKSSLLAKLTRATPKIGDYPFTTLEPNIGMMDKYTIADIPGLIKGASSGKGLGIQFLKHIEKTKILVHCIDITHQDPFNACAVIRHEFDKYNPNLLTKTEIIVLNKADLVTEKVAKNIFENFRKKHKNVLVCSIYDQQNITKLKQKITDLMIKEK